MDIYEYFAQKMNCCISDLRVGRTLLWTEETISAVPTEAFSPEEWSDFVSYAVSRDLHFDTVPAAKEFLLRRKTSKRDCDEEN